MLKLLYLQVAPPSIPPPPPPGLELDSSFILIILGLIYGIIILKKKTNKIDL